MTFRKWAPTTALTVFLLPVAAHATTSQDLSAQQKLAVTVYQNGLGFVRDVRRVSLEKGHNDLVLKNISRELIPDSLLLGGDGFTVLERRFDFDLLNAHTLLERSVGQEVSLATINPVTGKEDYRRVKVLSAQGGGIFEYNGKIEVGMSGRLVLDQLPDGLHASPALSTRVKADKKQSIDLSLAYLSNGLSWNAAYGAKLNAKGDQLTLLSWANVTNTSGVALNDTEIALGAGTINRQSPMHPQVQMMRKNTMAMAGAPAMEMDAVEQTAAPAESIGGMHLYRLTEKLDLDHNQTKQLALIPAATLPVKRTLESSFGPSYGQQYQNEAYKSHPQINLEFENKTGEPLPNGLVRFYQQDQRGADQFIGEAPLKNTPKGEKARLSPGQAFDVTIARKQTDYKIAGLPKNAFEAAWAITVRNAGSNAETVVLNERFPGQWTLQDQSVKPVETTGTSAKWILKLDPGQSQTLTYRVAVRTR